MNYYAAYLLLVLLLSVAGLHSSRFDVLARNCPLPRQTGRGAFLRFKVPKLRESR
jgi:hypothetical protein